MKRKIDYDRLREMRAKGMTRQQIAEVFGCHPTTLTPHIRRLGLQRKKNGPTLFLDRDPEKKRWFVKHYPIFSNTTVALYLGCSKVHVRYLARKLGLEKTEQFKQEAASARIATLRKYHQQKHQQ